MENTYKLQVFILSMILLMMGFDLPAQQYKKDSGEEGTIAHGKEKTVGGMEFVYIRGGSFWMGSKESPEELAKRYAKRGAKSFWFEREQPRHRVEVSGFWLGKYEVTQGQYESIIGSNPSKFKDDPRRPVDHISWLYAKDFCSKFSAKNGVKARLPTEAEWEYAARAGTETTFYWGDKIDGRYCWYGDNSNYTTHPVGGKRPNAWGLYDMSGNVWEWCEDVYAVDYYSKSPLKDPKGPESGDFRVLRGGSWSGVDNILRSAFRHRYDPGYWDYDYGFRVVLPASEN